MRPVYFYGAMSLDGYLADEHDDLQWLLTTDLAGHSTYDQFESQIDTLVMGRHTYDETKKMLGDAPFYPNKTTLVLSHTRTGQWPNGRYVSGDPAQIIRQLRQTSGSGIWIVGGGQLVATLLTADLIDELWVQVAPVLLGHGKRLFEPGDYRQRLTLVNVTRMGELTELHLKRK